MSYPNDRQTVVTKCCSKCPSGDLDRGVQTPLNLRPHCKSAQFVVNNSICPILQYRHGDGITYIYLTEDALDSSQSKSHWCSSRYLLHSPQAPPTTPPPACPPNQDPTSAQPAPLPAPSLPNPPTLTRMAPRHNHTQTPLNNQNTAHSGPPAQTALTGTTHTPAPNTRRQPQSRPWLRSRITHRPLLQPCTTPAIRAPVGMGLRSRRGIPAAAAAADLGF